MFVNENGNLREKNRYSQPAFLQPIDNFHRPPLPGFHITDIGAKSSPKRDVCRLVMKALSGSVEYTESIFVKNSLHLNQVLFVKEGRPGNIAEFHRVSDNFGCRNGN